MIITDLKLHHFGGGAAWTWKFGDYTYSLRLGSKGPLVNRKKNSLTEQIWWRDTEEGKEIIWFPGKSDASPGWHLMPFIRGVEGDRELLMQFLVSL